MKRIFVFSLFLLAAALSPLAGEPIIFVSNLSGPAEEPPNDSPGTGFTTVTIDPVAHTLRVVADFSDLLEGTTVAHIHLGFPTGNVATAVPTFPGFPAGVTSGSYDQTFDTLDPTTYNPAFLNNMVNLGNVATAETTLFAGIADGIAYLNIHTSAFMGGEIRGFLEPIPEPSTIGLAAGALAGLAMLRRRLATKSS
jgi:hypothetical protein